MADLGYIRPDPVTGRMSWPIRQLQVGDCFRVLAMDRTKAQVSMASKQMAKYHGYRLSITAEGAGYVVRRVEGWTPTAKAKTLWLDYQRAKATIAEAYGRDLEDDMRFVNVGQSRFFEGVLRPAVGEGVFGLWIADNVRYGVTMRSDGYQLTWMDDETLNLLD